MKALVNHELKVSNDNNRNDDDDNNNNNNNDDDVDNDNDNDTALLGTANTLRKVLFD